MWPKVGTWRQKLENLTWFPSIFYWWSDSKMSFSVYDRWTCLKLLSSWIQNLSERVENFYRIGSAGGKKCTDQLFPRALRINPTSLDQFGIGKWMPQNMLGICSLWNSGWFIWDRRLEAKLKFLLIEMHLKLSFTLYNFFDVWSWLLWNAMGKVTKERLR